MEKVSIGYLAGSHGLLGWAKVRGSGESWRSLSFPRKLILEKNQKHMEINVLASSPKPDYILIQAEGFSSPEDWEDWRGSTLSVSRDLLDAMELPENEYFYYQLVGLEVWDEKGEPTGFTVVQVDETSAHANLTLSEGGKKITVPFVSEWVGEVDLKSHRITVFGWEDWVAI